MTGPVTQRPDYDALISDLVTFRTDRLNGQPSDRTLAKAAEVSPTTIGNWLSKAVFPQQVDPLLKLVRAVRVHAERVGLADDPAAIALLEPQQWRRAYQAKARQNADGTRTAVQAEQGRAILEQMRPGLPLSEVTDPFHLEVHHAI